MSQREHRVDTEIASFRGVNERLEATLLDTSLVSSSRNIYFGLDGVASRIEGKQLAGILNHPIINIHQFGDRVLIQTTEDLQMIPLQDLLAGTFIVLPGTPDVPIFVSKTASSITILTPPAVTDADSYNLQMAVGIGSFATLQVGVTPDTEYSASGLSSLTQHYFRVVAINSDGSRSSGTLPVVTDEAAYLISDTDPDTLLLADAETDPVYLTTDDA